MHNQFWSGVKISDLLDELKPKLVLEAGFGAGTNMMMLMTYTKKPGMDYKIISLSDDLNVQNVTLSSDFIDRFIFVRGISYAMIENWKNLNHFNRFGRMIP